MAVDRLIRSGPQPLAQIALRARNSQTGAAMCQNAAHYLAEAGAALGAAYWFARAAEMTPALEQALVALTKRGASFGAWVGVLRESAAAAGGSALASLTAPMSAAAPLHELAGALAPHLEDSGPFGSKGAGLRDGLSRARKGGVLGFFDFLVAFRNAVYAHSWMLPETESRRLALPFLDAVASMLVEPCLFEESWLGSVSESFLQTRHWKKYSGLNVEFLPPEAEVVRPTCAPGLLHFVSAGRAWPLPFFVIADEDATGLSRFGFFSKLIGTRELEYIGYVSGPFRAPASGDLLARLGRDKSAPAEPASSSDRKFGDFIIDETAKLGSGAMGEVFRATQVTLGRSVALKILPASMAHDPVKMGRFHREVQALARCDHPNVVRVFAYGIEDQRPWYAMELLEGADLAQPRDRSRDWAALARLFAGAADGIAELHRHGVIHRDVKPSNLMLTAGGDRLVVMDLGLAKAADQSVAYTRQEHREFVGSVLYAAPEQIEAQLVSVDHRADIYGLGATLYEMATSKEMYDGTVEQILRRKLNEDPRRPRSVAPDLPPDLEVIIQKSTARDPSARYASAEALRDDLSAFAAGRPISARPPSWAYHLRMFHRQNRALVRASALALAVIVAVVAAAFVRVSEERAIAERNRAGAEKLVSVMLFDLRKKLVPIGKLELLETIAGAATSHYDHLPGEDAIAARNHAVALESWGDVELDRGETSRALEHFRRALSIRERLVARDETGRSELAANHDRIGDVLIARGESSEGLVEYRRAFELRKDLVRTSTIPQRRQELAVSHAKIGAASSALGELGEAVAILETLYSEYPANDPLAKELVAARRKLGAALLERNDFAGALAQYRAALALGSAIAARHPADVLAQRTLSSIHRAIGDALAGQGDTQSALASLRESAVVGEQLVARDPTNAEWQRDLGAVRLHIGRLLFARQGAEEEALAEFRAAAAIARRFAEKDATQVQWQRDLCASHNDIGRVLLKQNRRSEALVEYRRCQAIAEALVARDPENVYWKRDLSVARDNVGSVLFEEGDFAGALAAFRESLAITKELVAKDAGNTKLQIDLAIGHESVGDVLVEQQDWEAALAEYRAAMEINDRLATRSPENAERHRDLGINLEKVANALRARGDASASNQYLQRALQAAERAAAIDPASTEWKREAQELRERVKSLTTAAHKR